MAMLGDIHPIQVVMLGAIIALGALLVTGRRRAVQRLELACNQTATQTAEAMRHEFRIIHQGTGPDPLGTALDAEVREAVIAAYDLGVTNHQREADK